MSERKAAAGSKQLKDPAGMADKPDGRPVIVCGSKIFWRLEQKGLEIFRRRRADYRR